MQIRQTVKLGLENQ